jgi:hypothetical protein
VFSHSVVVYNVSAWIATTILHERTADERQYGQICLWSPCDTGIIMTVKPLCASYIGEMYAVCGDSTCTAKERTPIQVFIKVWSAAICRRFQKKKHCKIVSDTEWIKNTPIHICANSTNVGWPSTESWRISPFSNFLSCYHYFREHFKLLYRKNVIMATFTTGIMFLLLTCMHFRVWGILRRWVTCAPTADEVAAIAESLRNTAVYYTEIQ